MKELRVGIAGLGRLGRVHAANLAHKIPGAVQGFAFTPQKCGNGMQHTVLPSLAGRARRLQTSL